MSNEMDSLINEIENEVTNTDAVSENPELNEYEKALAEVARLRAELAGMSNKTSEIIKPKKLEKKETIFDKVPEGTQTVTMTVNELAEKKGIDYVIANSVMNFLRKNGDAWHIALKRKEGSRGKSTNVFAVRETSTISFK